MLDNKINPKNYSSHTLLFTATALLIVYFYVVIRYSADGPIYEDFDIIKFLLSYDDAENWNDKFNALMHLATHHHPSTTYLAFLLQYKIFGRIDFQHMVVVANLLVVIIAAIHLTHFRSSKAASLIALSTFALSLQLIPIGNIFWSGAALAGNFALLFAYLGFTLICRESIYSAIVGTVLCVASIYSLGNGIAVIPSAIMLVILYKRTKGTPKNTLAPIAPYYLIRNSTILIVASCLSLIPFFIFYRDIGINHFHVDFKNGNYSILALNVLRLLGGGYSYGNPIIECIMGIAMITGCTWLWYKGFIYRYPAVAAYLMFLIASMVLLGVSRNWHNLPDFSNTSRYRFLPMQAWTIVIIAFLEFHAKDTSNRFIATLLSSVFIFLFFFSYWFNQNKVIDYCELRNEYHLEEIKQIKESDEKTRFEDDNTRILKLVIERGLFDPLKMSKEQDCKALF